MISVEVDAAPQPDSGSSVLKRESAVDSVVMVADTALKSSRSSQAGLKRPREEDVTQGAEQDSPIVIENAAPAVVDTHGSSRPKR